MLKPFEPKATEEVPKIEIDKSGKRKGKNLM